MLNLTVPSVLFISDLHLSEQQPYVTTLLQKLLTSCNEKVQGIYILGDLFEVWIGDDDRSHFNRTIMNMLQDVVKKGIPIYFLHGNRDFLLGKRFAQETGCQFIADETTISVFGTEVLLMHGDVLCTNDHAYMKARKYCRNRLLQYIFLSLPLSFREKMAFKIRQKSMFHTQSTQSKLMDVDDSTVIHTMMKHKLNHLIHGHTHLPAIHHDSNLAGETTRIVLGAWHHEASVLLWNQFGEKKLLSFPMDTK